MDKDLTSQWPTQLMMVFIMAAIAPTFKGVMALAFFRTSNFEMTASSITFAS